MIKKRCVVCRHTARMTENDEKCFRCSNMTMIPSEDIKSGARWGVLMAIAAPVMYMAGCVLLGVVWG